MKSKMAFAAILAVLLTGALISCGATPEYQAATQPGLATMVVEKMVSESASGARSAEADAYQQAEVDRMLIWNAEIALTVKDAAKAMDDVQTIARTLGGYTVSSESWLDQEQLYARLTIRVPVDSYDSAMAQLRALALEITRETSSSEDVTDDYVDLGSRLRALEAKEAQLLKFMDQAEDTEAVLAVYEQLSATQAEIEQTRGRISYLEKLSAMATISVQLAPERAGAPVVEQGWKPLSTTRNAARSLVSTLQGLGKAIIWFVVYLLPVLLLLALPIVLIVLLIRGLRRRARRKQTQ